MPITKKQREQRINHLGSSDMAAILGVDKYRNAYDVWLEKTGRAELKETEIMYAGNVFEDGVLKFAEDQLGRIKRNQFRKAEGFPIGSNIDAIALDQDDEPVEAKISGMFGPLVETWGDPGTDEIPDRVIVQAHCHMLCTDKEVCHVAAFLGGRGFNMYKVVWDDDIADLIRDKSIEFWDNYVQTNSAPPNIIPSLIMVQRMRREPKKIVTIPDEMVVHWLNAKASLKHAEEIEEAAKTQLLAALGDAEGGAYTGGMITYFSQSRRGIDIKRLREEKPDIAKEYQVPTVYRVLRHKLPKKGKI